MTRSTRSTATQQQHSEKDKPLSDTPKKTPGLKKRKRTSVADQTEQPANKVVRTLDDVKDEGSPGPGGEQTGETVAPVDLPSSGEQPLSSEDAEQILDVLEMVDTQGLLDRIFPLPTGHTSTSESNAGPSTGTQSYSFRALLKSPSNFPLRVLRTAVKHLFPISSHPRSRPSAPAAEQIRFCQLALSLLDQASCHQAPVPLDLPSLIPPPRAQGEQSGNSSIPRNQRRYAMVQHLPTGDWWSSLNSSNSTLQDGKDLKDLGIGHAELVAILPSASTSEPPPDSSTLGHYIKKRTVKPQHVPRQRTIPCGSFLDYGPYASFAPTFEQNGVEIGKERLSEVVWFKEKDRRRREQVRAYREKLAAKAAQASATEAEVEEDGEASARQKEKMKEEDISALEGLLTPEQVENVKGALDSIELENAVSELLERNTLALARLEALQLERLGEGSKDVEVGSEEWETAQNILQSLTLLASLRPRPSINGDSAPLIPPASTLRKLHRSLPVGTMQGWYGTFSDSRQVACSDDNTIRIRSGASAASPVSPAPSAPAPTAPVPAATATPSKPTATTYGGYSYSSSYATPFRGGYGANYYPNYQTPSASASTTNHYPNHQYTTSGQQPYSAFSSWYNYQPQTGGSTTPVTKTTGGFSGYFGTTQQPTPQRAVANTVLSSSGTAGRTWPNGSAYVAPTIPPHMRSATGGGSASTPGTPQPTGAGGYYIGIQQQQQQQQQQAAASQS